MAALISQLLLSAMGWHALFSLGAIRKERPPNPRYQIIVFGLLLAAVIAGALRWSRGSGYVLALPWLVVVILPAFLAMQVNVAVRQDNPAAITRWLRWLRWLRPRGKWRSAEVIYQMHAATSHGRWGDVVALIESNRSSPGELGDQMQLNWLSWRHNWSELLARTGDRVVSNARDQVFLGTMRVRALAELGRWDECLVVFEELDRWSKHQDLAPAYLAVLALSGQVEPVRRLLKASRMPSSPVSEYWIGVAWLAAGDREQGARILEAMVQAGDSAVQEQARWRIETTRPPALSQPAQDRLGQLIAAWPLLAGPAAA
jgi:hypothetical protein